MSSRSKKYSLQDYLRWNENKNINPKTGREIKINGPTYNLIQEGWTKLQKDTDYTPQECNQWIGNKSINPRTKKNIKHHGNVYETLRTKCEAYSRPNNIYEHIMHEPSVNYNDINYRHELNREVDIESRLIDDLNAVNISSEQEDEIIGDNRSDVRRFELSKLPFTKLTCREVTCMMLGCPWSGRFGINFTVLPKPFIKGIKYFFPDLSPDRCCCMCGSHMILFMTFLGSKAATKCISKDIKELNKVQDVINKLETNPHITETMKNTLIKEGNIAFSKQTDQLFQLGVPYLKHIFNAVKESGPGYYQNIVTGMTNAINIFTCQ